MAALRPSPRFAERLLLRTRLASPSGPRLLPLPMSQRCSSARFYSSEEPPPPLLRTLKDDLKTAMRAKDAPRLSVIRSVISAVNNASKTASPMTSNVHIVTLMRKTIRASLEARAEFASAGREDLVNKEDLQIAILEEYIERSGVNMPDARALPGLIDGVVEAAGGLSSVNFGIVMKALFSRGGFLDGVDVDKAYVADLVKERLAKAK